LHLALRGRAHALRLPQRPGSARPPRVRVLDLRKRVLEGGLGSEAVEAIAACLARGEQALVFKNRRGYAPALLCHDCGWSAVCARCDSAMTLHAGARRLLCHHCGARAPRPPACPDCASLGLQPQGVGTERVEETLSLRFPDARVVRIDRETTRKRGRAREETERVWRRLWRFGRTQMLAKGHDLPRLTLVVVVGIDEGLFSADFRAGERNSRNCWCRSRAAPAAPRCRAKCCCRPTIPGIRCWPRCSPAVTRRWLRWRWPSARRRDSRPMRTWRCCVPRRCARATCRPSWPKRARC
jgi:primosomal protein N' (replication factor Y)